MAYAQTYTSKIGNQTFNIIIKPNNTIVIQPSDNIKLEQILQKLVDNNSTNEDKKLDDIVQKLTLKEHNSWNSGDIIIASSTIIAFFSFNSFLIIRFKRKRLLGALLSLMDNIILSVLMIQLICILLIVSVLANILRPETFYISFTLIGFFIVVIAFSIREIIKYENVIEIQSQEVEMAFKKTSEILKKYQDDAYMLEEDSDEDEDDDGLGSE